MQLSRIQKLKLPKTRPPMMGKIATQLTGPRGYSLVELLTGIAIFSVLLAVGLPHLNTHRQDINSAVTSVIADIRFARSKAIRTGAHYAVELLDEHTYQVQRFREVDAGNWQFESIVKTAELPEHINLDMDPTLLEFNTRGMMISDIGNNSWVKVAVTDDAYGASHEISVWPSGQVYYEN